MKSIKSSYCAIVFALLVSMNANAQTITFDNSHKIDDVWLFQSIADENKFYYLPTDIAFETNSSGLPSFSFMKYRKIDRTVDENDSAVNESAGGAILHFILKYDTPNGKINEAEEGLQKKLKNQSIYIAGPISFKSGNLMIISSTIKKNKLTEGERDTTIIAVNSAPILEGSTVANSFRMEAKSATILNESLKNPTADVSVTFELEFEGFEQTYKAEILAHWEQIYENTIKTKSENFLFSKNESMENIQDLVSNQSIEVKTMGEDTKTIELLDKVYEKMLGLIFQPVDLKTFKEDKGTVGDMNDAFKGFVDGMKDLSSFGLSSMGSMTGYKHRKIKKSGTSTINLNKSSKGSKYHYITMNFGGLFEEHGDNKKLFPLPIDLEDPDFAQRPIFVGLDGLFQENYKILVNNINLEIRKQHKDGTVTLASNHLTDARFKKPIVEYYKNKGDFTRESNTNEKEKWREYEYRAVWNFKGGVKHDAGWEKTNSDMINLAIPFEERELRFTGDLNEVWDAGVNAVVIEFQYKFYDKFMSTFKRITIVKGEPNLEVFSKTYMVPESNTDYRYRIKYVTPENANLKIKDMDWQHGDDGIIPINFN